MIANSKAWLSSQVRVVSASAFFLITSLRIFRSTSMEAKF
jgi:hypothetical protein